jgi:hypothetical protein
MDTTTPRYPDVAVHLTGTDGNAFAIIGKVVRALRSAGVDPDTIAEYRTQATAGNYANLLAVTFRWVEID